MTASCRRSAILALAALGMAWARPAPGWTLDSTNAARYRDLLPEPVYRRLAAGQYRFEVVDVDPKRFRANYSDRFWKASRANAGRYAIDGETGGLMDPATGRIPGRLYGLPFPEIRPEDPQAGAKVMQNYLARKAQADGQRYEFQLVDVRAGGDVIRAVKVLLTQRYFFGTTAEPPDELPDNTEWRQLAAALEPKDLEGVGVLTWRFHDWTSWDRVWAYMPNIRRVRRIRTSSRGERIPGFEVSGDDADCYDGKVTYFRWSLAGTGEVIGPLGSRSPYARTLRPAGDGSWSMELPYNAAVYETPGATGAGWLTLNNAFVRRPVWIVEGRARDPYYGAGRIVLYVDRDLYHAYYKIAYTPAGEQYQTTFCGTVWGRTPDGSFAAPASALVIGVNEKEDRGTPAGRFTRHTFVRRFPQGWFTPESLARLSGAATSRATASPAPATIRP